MPSWRALLSHVPPIPSYYRHMAPLNRQGQAAIELRPARELGPEDLDAAIEGAEWVVDLRPRRTFAAGHRLGTLNLELGVNLTTYLGWLVPWESELVLLAEDPDEIAEARRLIARIGRDELAGRALWTTATAPAGDGAAEVARVGSYPVSSFSELADAWPDRSAPGPQVFDVRHPHEWEDGHIEGAHLLPLPELVRRRGELPRGVPVWVHCGAGFRAAAAASLLSGWGASPILIDDTWVQCDRTGSSDRVRNRRPSTP